MTTVSVLIRNRNEADRLRSLLARLQAQRRRPDEVIVVDNESTDGSRAAIAEFGATLVHLPAGSFTYGRATNLGFQCCSGELVLMLSAHSLPVGAGFIAEVTAPFANPQVAAVRIPIAANTRELSNVALATPLDQESTARDIFGRGPVASGCVVRRSVWERFRIDETLEAAEDKEWAMRVLRAGGSIMPVVDACYVYDKSYGRQAWLRKLMKEERAGFEAAGLRRGADWQHLLKTIVVAGRDALNTVKTETALYRFRRSLR